MDGKAIRLVQYLEGSDKRFIIPVYQRNYSWKKDNCRQLYDDLIRVITNKRKMHFFGSIVSVYNSSYEEYLVIDGQQRLTTISLLLLAIHNALKDGKVKSDDDKLESRVLDEYLVDKYEPTEKRIKLKAVNKDLEAFTKLFEEEPEDYLHDSDITLNYEYFYDRIQKEEITADQLFDAIKKLMVINITVSPEDNPQLIFESLNSTGVDLTEGDKIRNFILMGLERDKQEEFYKKYWVKIELNTKGDNNTDVSAFIRDYLSMKNLETPSLDKVYPVFKLHVQGKGIETEELLQDLLYHSKNYSVLLKANFGDEVVDASIARLNHLETVVCRPFYLVVLDHYKNDELSIQDVRAISNVVENYLFRRNICDVATNALNKIFLLLDRDISKLEGSSYVERMKYVLSMKKESGRFPTDTEFRQALSEKQVYKMRGRYKTYLFERYENWGTDEIKDVYQRIESGKYTIEHIMPQHLTPAWEEALGQDYKLVHEEWLHRLGNLTLTAYNSTYSNNTFLEKRDAENGFANSGIRMNIEIAKKDKWTLEEIEERSDRMVEKAISIWSYPYTNYKPAEKELESVSLDDDDVDLTGCTLAKFSFKNAEQPAESWTDMYVKVLKMLHSDDASLLTRLAYENDVNVDLSTYFSTNENAFNSNSEIAAGIYVLTGLSTQQKASVLRRVFKLYGVDASELVFFLKDQETEEKAVKSEAARFELRRRYWSFALPYIQKEHGVNGSFSNVHPGKDNWLSGWFGISGFNVSCVANYDLARIDFYMGKSNRDLNKQAFDLLVKHKSEIEEELGVSLNWDRGENIKASFISYALNGVSITNETDWIRMAKFHAEWSKKICDVLLPYLKDLYPDVKA
ncbi:Uncharacterized conserved protein, contains ParB-like and HNH nuclease domains [Pseudobutyrivibrio sp. ACV-2]|uniref:DUF4268 domain-containing protein n=1 Tax=Pseudobutyrivibrio sp. ACV-2 TaxID=1520801 RepID=UPI00089D98CC|nr:DUF4268 domain-containing protein [Pseudobutyrivibrio sp. ACV-2]SDZ76384.1 Uncharacterized conserved protein, contains ParB-like and HNH nuclease domains [Pseudobutyrivibrio sp. ACV-2]